MLKPVRNCLAVLWFAFLMAGQEPPAQEISLCTLLRNPELYDGKEVILQAGYRVGFEWQTLVCAPCQEKQTIWVEFASDVKGAKKLGKYKGWFDSIYNVRLRGVFNGKRGYYGHLSGYDYQFLVREILSARHLWHTKPHQGSPPEALESSVCHL